MFSQQEILHFRTFGYVVARHVLSDTEITQLSAEVTSALTDAYGGVGTDIGGVRFLVHLQPRALDTGALRVIPGSHDGTYRRSVEQYFGQDPARQGFSGWPAPFIGLETAPGDVIAFDLHLVHSSAGGTDRLAWTIEYLPWRGLGDAARLAAVRAAVVDIVDYDHKGYDRDRWPTWRDWAANAHRVPSRQSAIERLTLLGVLGAGDPLSERVQSSDRQRAGCEGVRARSPRERQ